MSTRQFTSAIGFASVAAWITLGFGRALLCLLAAIACYVAATLLERFSLEDLQRGFARGDEQRRSGPATPPMGSRVR